MSETILWDYPKSSASYRVRIALNLAGISYETRLVNLLEGEHKSEAHLSRNPQGLVPVLDIDGHRFTQSLAIIRYLDDTRALGFFPKDPVRRAQVEALAFTIAIDLHPVCNLGVAKYATGGKDPARTNWMRHFIPPALSVFESQLAGFDQDPFCTGTAPSVADLCLIPQLYNANRWDADYTNCPRIRAIESACERLTAFQRAKPT